MYGEETQSAVARATGGTLSRFGKKGNHTFLDVEGQFVASALIGYLRYGLLHNCYSELFTRVAVEKKDVVSEYEYRFIVLISELKIVDV